MKYIFKAEYFGTDEDGNTDYEDRHEVEFTGDTLKEVRSKYDSFVTWEYCKGDYAELSIYDFVNLEEE